MAVNNSRSLKASLSEGSTDGKYRKARPNTEVATGMGEEIVKANRADLNPYWNYDFIDKEAPVKVEPVSDSARPSRMRNLPVADTMNNQMGANY